MENRAFQRCKGPANATIVSVPDLLRRVFASLSRRFRMPRLGGLQKLYLVSSHNESILLETILEGVAIFAPPLLVQLLHHDLIDDQVITHNLLAIVPQPMNRRARICGYAANRSISRYAPRSKFPSRIAFRNCYREEVRVEPDTYSRALPSRIQFNTLIASAYLASIRGGERPRMQLC